MQDKPTIIFYTLEACSLCDNVDNWLAMLAADKKYNIQKIDIVGAENSEELVQKYGSDIPVLERKNHAEISIIKAPFGLLDLQTFLSE